MHAVTVLKGETAQDPEMVSCLCSERSFHLFNLSDIPYSAVKSFALNTS